MGLFSKKPAAAAPIATEPAVPAASAVARVEWGLALLLRRVHESAPALEARDIEAELVHARIADLGRDVGVMPVDPAKIRNQTADLDIEGWRRLALAAAMLDDGTLRGALAALQGFESGLIATARNIAPVTVALVRRSEVRAEEFGRRLAAELGLAIAGETDERSRQRLESIDYKRLLAEAEQAKAAAQVQMEKLRKKQEELDLRRRRGKH